MTLHKLSRRNFLLILAIGWSTVRRKISFASTAAREAVLTRGPYLQMTTQTSVVIRWRTDIETTGRVHYGNRVGSLRNVAEHLGKSTEHWVQLVNLKPGVKYYYRIGTADRKLAGDDHEHFVITMPPDGAQHDTRIWVIGDSGTGTNDALAVRDRYYEYEPHRETDVWLLLGDNAYGDGTDEEYQEGLFDVYGDMLKKTSAWPTFGNHDSYCEECNGAAQVGPYFDNFEFPMHGEFGGAASQNKAYYSFDHDNIHFVCLDSTSTSRRTDGAMLTWLRRDLEATDRQWIVAFWHHPPYTKGSHDSDDLRQRELVDMRTNAVPILEEFDVDLVLCGHSHNYERSFLIRGHYSTSDLLSSRMLLDTSSGSPLGTGPYHKTIGQKGRSHGAVFVTLGCSGWLGDGPLNHPVMARSLNSLGSLVIDVRGHTLEASFLDDQGTVRDRFAMTKGYESFFPIVRNS